MLTPTATDPNRAAELRRKEEDPSSFGLLSMDLSRMGEFFVDHANVTERVRPSEIILPTGVKK